MVVAMDGPACSGKSTLAVLTAKALNIHFLNTGMIFRAIAYLLDKNDVDVMDVSSIQRIINEAKIEVEFKNGEQVVYINNIDTRNFVSLHNISQKASLFSQILIVREKVKEIQHKFAQKYDLVVEGRDIGTEIFPDAKYKFYVTASIDARAKRRFETLKQQNANITLQKVKEDLLQRDYNDSHRELSPLTQAKDAILIDTSNETIDQSLNKILSFIK